MEFLIKRDVLLKSLNLAQGIIEKKNTLPILSNVLLQAKNNKLAVVATDLDLVFYDENRQTLIPNTSGFVPISFPGTKDIKIIHGTPTATPAVRLFPRADWRAGRNSSIVATTTRFRSPRGNMTFHARFIN